MRRGSTWGEGGCTHGHTQATTSIKYTQADESTLYLQSEGKCSTVAHMSEIAARLAQDPPVSLSVFLPPMKTDFADFHSIANLVDYAGQTQRGLAFAWRECDTAMMPL